MNREQQTAMQLAGTVAVPQKFPQLAFISFSINGTDSDDGYGGFDYLAVDHLINAKLRIRRSFRTGEVSAVFLPWSCDSVDLRKGEWFLGGEIAKALPTVLDNRGGTAPGIAYVPEQVSTLMQVEVGMTAAESVDYYPPLPDDRTVDHYAMGSTAHEEGSRPDLSDPCSVFAQDPCSLFAARGGPRQSAAEQQQTLDPCSKLIW